MIPTTCGRDRSDNRPVIRLHDHRPAQLVAWRKARAHLLSHGLWPVVPQDVECALRARGGWK